MLLWLHSRSLIMYTSAASRLFRHFVCRSIRAGREALRGNGLSCQRG